MLKWGSIIECDDEENNPTCWAAVINHEKYGKYVWITQQGEHEYHIETDNGTIEMRTHVICKSLTSAKRWVSMYLK